MVLARTQGFLLESVDSQKNKAKHDFGVSKPQIFPACGAGSRRDHSSRYISLSALQRHRGRLTVESLSKQSQLSRPQNTGTAIPDRISSASCERVPARAIAVAFSLSLRLFPLFRCVRLRTLPGLPMPLTGEATASFGRPLIGNPFDQHSGVRCGT